MAMFGQNQPNRVSFRGWNSYQPTVVYFEGPFVSTREGLLSGMGDLRLEPYPGERQHGEPPLFWVVSGGVWLSREYEVKMKDLTRHQKQT